MARRKRPGMCATLTGVTPGGRNRDGGTTWAAEVRGHAGTFSGGEALGARDTAEDSQSDFQKPSSAAKLRSSARSGNGAVLTAPAQRRLLCSAIMSLAAIRRAG